MTRRAWSGFAAAVVIAAMMRGDVTGQGQGPTPQASRNVRTWVGTIDNRLVLNNLTDESPARHPAKYFHDIHVSWVYVSEGSLDDLSSFRWISRRVHWTATGSTSSLYTGSDCETHGNVDLGPSRFDDQVTPEQNALFKMKCKNWEAPGNWTFVKNLPPSAPLPNVDETMTNCQPTRSWTSQGVHYTQSVFGGELHGAFRGGDRAADWVPSPGAAYQIKAAATSPARWKFVVESSRLRGYATNADVDDVFLYREGLGDFASHYATLDPDLIFDARPHFYQQEASVWKRPSPGSGTRKWSTIESQPGVTMKTVDTSLLIAMDYGAHGELRAYMTPPCGGVWMDVPVEHSQDTVLKIPKDDDGNFIADAEQRYSGLTALSDDDDDPKGDGTKGDGFTAFEEYRGFAYSEQVMDQACQSRLFRYERMDPKKKDLFIHASDPLLWRHVESFGQTSGLNVHMLCPEYYGGDDVRVVNFTMHSISGPSALGEALHGARLTQDKPQHGIYVVNQQTPGGGLLAQSIGVGGRLGLGPPVNVDRVAVDIPAIRASYGATNVMRFLTVITHHELGHAIGIQHHGDGNMSCPIVLLHTPGCIVGMTEGMVDGQPACLVQGIATRNQQNSGNQLCPMKYLHWKWYVPPGSSLTRTDMVEFRPNTSWPWQRPQRAPAYDGRVQRYRKDLDTPPSLPDMKFCTSATGTGINAQPMELNHAGNSSRPPCAMQLRVTDIGAPSRPLIQESQCEGSSSR